MNKLVLLILCLLPVICYGGMAATQTRVSPLTVTDGVVLSGVEVSIVDGVIKSIRFNREKIRTGSDGVVNRKDISPVFAQISTTTIQFSKINPNTGNVRAGTWTWDDVEALLYSAFIFADR